MFKTKKIPKYVKATKKGGLYIDFEKAIKSLEWKNLLNKIKRSTIFNK